MGWVAADRGGAVEDSSQESDEQELTAAVRVALGRPEATVGGWQLESLHGLGFGAAIHRVSGVASQGEAQVPWSVIRKQVRDAGDGPADFSYWRREPLAYACGLLAELNGVAAPVCLAQSEQAGSVVLWLEDLADDDGGRWTVERYGTVARGLGQLGAHAASRPVPEWPWLSRGLLASWVEQGAAGFEVFAEAVRDPLLARLYPPEVSAVMVELWRARGRICDVLAGWPQVLGHLDAVPANVIVRGGRTYLIDWAFVGRAALGEELAPLAAGSGLFGGMPAGQMAAIDQVAFPAYLDGLRAAGWAGDPARVRFAYCAAAALRFCAAVTTWLVCGINPDGTSADTGGLRDPGQRTLFEGFFGRPFAEVQQEFAAGFRFLATSLGAEALELLPRVSVS